MISSLTTKLRRLLGRILQFLFHDRISELDRETERLGAATVESANYLGMELADIDRRLERIESEIANLVEAVSADRPPAE